MLTWFQPAATPSKPPNHSCHARYAIAHSCHSLLSSWVLSAMMVQSSCIMERLGCVPGFGRTFGWGSGAPFSPSPNKSGCHCSLNYEFPWLKHHNGWYPSISVHLFSKTCWNLRMGKRSLMLVVLARCAAPCPEPRRLPIANSLLPRRNLSSACGAQHRSGSKPHLSQESKEFLTLPRSRRKEVATISHAKLCSQKSPLSTPPKNPANVTRESPKNMLHFLQGG